MKPEEPASLPEIDFPISFLQSEYSFIMNRYNGSIYIYIYIDPIRSRLPDRRVKQPLGGSITTRRAQVERRFLNVCIEKLDIILIILNSDILNSLLKVLKFIEAHFCHCDEKKKIL